MSSRQIIYVAIIDDNEGNCQSLGRLLRAAGFQPVTYLSANEFLEDLKHPQFDCLVLDVQLGGMSGIELKARLDQEGSTIPVIYVTAHDEIELREKALATGCVGYFRRTDSGSDILKAIRSAVDGSNSASP